MEFYIFFAKNIYPPRYFVRNFSLGIYYIQFYEYNRQ